jgi:hypothetical protein
MAQIAVGLTHARRGNDRGAVALLRRGARHARENADGSAANRAGIDAEYVAAQADGLAARIERDGLAAIAPSDLLVRLLAA